ncbi:hypothetical protein HYPSUDRAFT_687524 [Hypholoma sublateritium FD-334 SS-4]|uniref:Cytochrome P450 n=1 Tax=Hypholoma sublateritium (strain FD-334 SS-4) TaxID=945553 RepID=A0A0D2MDT0_HYPSF|nr:hypothetical protein HYPSUDRAFT_687524 [Hypholoma sublateritium FD-334 SS-4]
MIFSDFSDFVHSPFPVIGSVVLAASIFVYVLCYLRSPLHKLPYPPGPPEKGLISGNQSDLPPSQPYLTYLEWGKKYGDVIHYRTYSKHTIVLNAYDDNVELLDKRSLIYSDRPYLAMMDLMGWLDFNHAFMHYGTKWRSHRRIFQQFFRLEVASKYQPTQAKKNLDLLYGLLTTPEDFIKHYRTLAAAIIMSITYGHDVTPKNDHFVDLAENAMSHMSGGFAFIDSLFHSFPIICHLPAFLPGLGFKRFALEGKRSVLDMLNIPLGIVQSKMKDGTAADCVAADLLESCQSDEQRDAIAGVIATAYAAGSDTTVSSIGTFFHAMTLFPDIQQRAKQEIDAVVGCEQLITYKDRLLLPYVEAVFREILRWRPVVPLSISHASTSDDVYNGYYIPKEIVTNVWAIAHNPEKYPEPETFDPSRFLDENGHLNDDNVGYVFGFGRRICPGRHLASDSVWLTIATVLQNFDIQKKRDSNGKEIPISGEYSDGLIAHPVPFECTITPRSTASRDLILEAVGKFST